MNPKSEISILNYWSIPSNRMFSYFGQDVSGRKKSVRGEELISKKT